MHQTRSSLTHTLKELTPRVCNTTTPSNDLHHGSNDPRKVRFYFGVGGSSEYNRVRDTKRDQEGIECVITSLADDKYKLQELTKKSSGVVRPSLRRKAFGAPANS